MTATPWRCLQPDGGASPVLVHMGKLPEAVVSNVPHKELCLRGKDISVFRHDYDTWRKLRQVGAVVPSPLRHYDWPGPYTPKPHQVATADFQIEHDRGFVLNGIGTGKTAAALWAMDYLRRAGAVRRVLVVAPLTLCRNVWMRELFKILPRTRAVFLGGKDRKTKQSLAKDKQNEVLVINPESVGLIEDKLPEVDLLIVDEFTKFKNPGALRYKALFRASRGRRVWMLSATPAPQTPLDAFGPIRLVNPNIGLTKTSWRDMTMHHISTWTWKPKKTAVDTIHKYMQPAIRFTREECYELEDVQTIPLEVERTAKQSYLIRELFNEGSLLLESGEEVTAVNAGAFFQKAQQILLGFAYTANGPAEIGATPLYETAREIVAGSDTPVLVFAPFKEAVYRLQKDLTKHGHRAKYITSDVNERERSEIFNQFQDKEIDAIVAVPGTMSHGLNLISGNVVVWCGAPTSFETYDQAIGRVARMGQTRQVVNYQLSNHRITDDLFKRLDTKEKLQTTLLKLYERG